MTAPVPAFLADPRDPWMTMPTEDRNAFLRAASTAIAWLLDDCVSDEDEAEAKVFNSLLKRYGGGS